MSHRNPWWDQGSSSHPEQTPILALFSLIISWTVDFPKDLMSAIPRKSIIAHRISFKAASLDKGLTSNPAPDPQTLFWGNFCTCQETSYIDYVHHSEMKLFFRVDLEFWPALGHFLSHHPLWFTKNARGIKGLHVLTKKCCEGFCVKPLASAWTPTLARVTKHGFPHFSREPEVVWEFCESRS